MLFANDLSDPGD